MQSISAKLQGGGPFDGLSLMVNPATPEITLPFNDEMLALLAKDEEEKKIDWRSFSFPDGNDAKGYAVYVRETKTVEGFNGINEVISGHDSGFTEIIYRFREVIPIRRE